MVRSLNLERYCRFVSELYVIFILLNINPDNDRAMTKSYNPHSSNSEGHFDFILIPFSHACHVVESRIAEA